MAQNDIFKRYLDAGVAFTQMTRERAEAIVSDFVKMGEVRRNEAEQQIEQLLERSRQNTEELLGLIRREVAAQLKALNLDGLAKRAGLTGTPNAAKATPAAKKPATATKKAPSAAKKPATAAKKPAAAAKKPVSAAKKPAAAVKKPAPAKAAATKNVAAKKPATSA